MSGWQCRIGRHPVRASDGIYGRCPSCDHFIFGKRSPFHWLPYRITPVYQRRWLREYQR